MRTLGALDGLVVLDEVQREPGLFEILRVLADRPDSAARFLLLGSASPTLVRGASESLAGRLGLFDLGGLPLAEAGDDTQDRPWGRGGFPRAYLAADDAGSFQ